MQPHGEDSSAKLTEPPSQMKILKEWIHLWTTDRRCCMEIKGIWTKKSLVRLNLATPWTGPKHLTDRATLQIFIVILLCKSIKSIGIIYNLIIEIFFCKFYHWNPGMANKLSKSSKNKSQCCSELLWVYNKFWYECMIELIGNNL